MKTIALIVFLPLFLTGCFATTGGSYDQYVKAQTATTELAIKEQKPLVNLTAQTGQAITGLASLEVYMPVNTPQIQQQRPNEWASVAEKGLGVVGTVMGIKAAGDAAVGIAGAVGSAATKGYEHVQAPTTTTTYTSGNNSVVGGGQYTANPTHYTSGNNSVV
jgi:hypothetical protein